ncbi:hypothetical protein HDU86_006582 [Geranomyces michiganensis]|nr:hypothetical protein HDU86_006582 [Geranomyces michiganensis]
MDHSKMDHTTMDHSGHLAGAGSAGMGHGSMAMVWNWSYDSVVVFEFWTSDGPGTLFLSCLAIFLLSFFFEGFRSFRNSQDRRLLAAMEKPLTNDRYEGDADGIAEPIE